MLPDTTPVTPDAHTLALRLRFFRIDPGVLARLAALRPFAERTMSDIIDRFYEHLLSQPETRDYLDDPALVERLKRKQAAYFLGMFRGEIDLAYVQGRMKVGAVHAKLAVATQWYVGACTHYLQLIHEHLHRERASDEERRASFEAIERIMHFDVSLAIDAYIARHHESRLRHQEAIRELSTPVIRVHDRVLLLPLVGTIDSARAQRVMESVLVRIGEEHARVLLLDIAGVTVVDTQVADYLLKTTSAVRLLGAKTILTGISPQVARTVVELGVDLTSLYTRNTLSDGLDLALSLLDKQIRTIDQERV
ncbi:MAG TPA: STAS domain-containing protein [Deltaproteobacteria bacterium]|nr:STAS domain-containing protein [Deltaproteobacteria bacterium]